MKLTTAAVFSSDMVLQQGSVLPVWGSAPPGTAVVCRLCPQRGPAVSACARSDEAGRWRLALPALPAGGPYALEVSGGGEALCYSNVWLGEVFLAGGQSNMELELQNSKNGAAALRACADPRLHFYAVPKAATPAAAAEAEAAARWRVVGPDTAAALSAVAYYAARTLAAGLPEVHIGVIVCCWGGTYAHCWLPRAELAAFPEGQRRLAWYDARVGDKTDEQFAAENAAYQAEVDAWNTRIAARRAADPDVSWAVLDRDCGKFPWPPPAGRTGYQRPGNLYEAMLRRVCPYAVRGFWYYQGEQDEEWPRDYRALLTRLVRRWRADWGDTGGRLPFLLVQLPMFGGAVPGSWPVLRAAQSAVARTEPAAGLAVLADCGEADNIHPADKETPGTRLGLLTLEKVFRRPVTGTAPQAACVDFAGHCVLLRFAHCGGTLALRGRGEGFCLAGADGVYHAAAAEVLPPDTVRLTCPQVAYPVAVRYAWADFGPAGLFGGTGLPAEPFSLPE